MIEHRRNIILFLTDDHARWALPAYGNGAIKAPNLDALAARGAVFEDAYTTSPVCSPARASLMTGLMPSEHGIHDFLLSNPAINNRNWLEGLPTLAEKLSAAGYRCGMVGKWHVGDDARPAAGFEFWDALNGEYPIHHDGDNGFSRDGTEYRVVGNLTDAITARAHRFLDEGDQRPYFLVVGYYATHSPWRDQPQALLDLYAEQDFSEIDAGMPAAGAINVELPNADLAEQRLARQNYYAAVTHIDSGVGAVLARTNPENTAAIYTTDHGLMLGQHGVWGKGNATRPQNLLDDSIRIPLIIAGPGIPAGRHEGFVDHRDTHHAILGLAGLEPAVLPSPHPVQFSEYGTARMARNATHKLIAWTTGQPPQLYRLDSGAETRIDLNADAAAIAASLQHELDAFFAAHADPARNSAEALASGRFNFNQAWHPFVPRVPAGGTPL